MEHLDERIISIVKKVEQKLQKQLSWEDQVESIVKSIPRLHVTQNELDIEMKKLVLFDQKLEAYIPNDYLEMDIEDVKAKYPHDARPKIIYRNKKDTVNIGFNILEEGVPDDELLSIRDVMKNAFLAISPSSTILDEGDFIQSKSKAAYYSFNSFAIGGQMYNLLFVSQFGSKSLLICNFNCLKKDMDVHKLLFYGIMKTFVIIDN